MVWEWSNAPYSPFYCLVCSADMTKNQVTVGQPSLKLDSSHTYIRNFCALRHFHSLNYRYLSCPTALIWNLGRTMTSLKYILCQSFRVMLPQACVFKESSGQYRDAGTAQLATAARSPLATSPARHLSSSPPHLTSPRHLSRHNPSAGQSRDPGTVQLATSVGITPRQLPQTSVLLF